jgi:hypothetical protein
MAMVMSRNKESQRVVVVPKKVPEVGLQIPAKIPASNPKEKLQAQPIKMVSNIFIPIHFLLNQSH